MMGSKEVKKNEAWFLVGNGKRVLGFDVDKQEVREVKVNKYWNKVTDYSLYLEPTSGNLVMSGGINTLTGKVETKCLLLNCSIERLIALGDMSEPKHKH